MPRHVDWEFYIHLNHVGSNEIGGKEEYFKTIQDRYQSSYLEALGVEPTPYHRALVARHAPLHECEIEAAWVDTSAVANKLRIVQPMIKAVCEVEAEAQDTSSMTNAQRNAEFKGFAKYVSVADPEVRTFSNAGPAQAQGVGTEGKGRGSLDPKGTATAHALAKMQLRDLAASEGCDIALTEELEQMRRQARISLEEENKQDGFGKLMKRKGKREADEQELERLKNKFILPYACERPAKSAAAGTVLIPWQSKELQANCALNVHPDFLPEARKPIMFTIEQIGDECFRYAVTGFPVDLLTTRNDVELFAAVREQLATEESVRLTGLLSHFLYWIILGHVHPSEQRLPEQSKQSLLLTIQELWSMIQAPARQRLGRRGELLAKDGPAGISFVIPAFMLAIKRGVEWVFMQAYPWIFADEDLKQQFIDQLNITFMRLFDPDCLYASFGALEASERAIHLWHKLGVLQASLGITPAARMLNQEYRTTPLMSLLLNSDGCNPGDPQTRRLLAKSQSDGALVHAPGSHEAKSKERVPLDGWRRAALYRSANKRLEGLARAGLNTVQGKKVTVPDQVKVSNFMKADPMKKPGRRNHKLGTGARSSTRTSTVTSEASHALTG
mmetsp:Transcript_57617/g.100820  ORF Transcript_57617/g.100820 Transcript_57617/m.100820 type:complete len:615 (-) Transcript_57617:139-1983(-)